MKKLVLGIALLVSATAANAWYCESYSSEGTYGWGQSPYRNVAWNIALNNCRARTSQWGWCGTPSCW